LPYSAVTQGSLQGPPLRALAEAGPSARNGSMTMLVAGVDGCRAGWVVVFAQPAAAGRLTLRGISVFASFAAVLDATRESEAVALDMPVGLSESGRRRADEEARRLLGARRSSVFSPPARTVLDAAGSYGEANALSRAACGLGLSRQAFNILPKIGEVDACMSAELQSRVVEAHPELCFRQIQGGPLAFPKRHPSGRSERLEILDRVYREILVAVRPPVGAAADDVLDAAVLAWTAARLTRGDAKRMPAEPELDARGLRMEIVW
jgi:predicted RNase H-like nuclease